MVQGQGKALTAFVFSVAAIGCIVGAWLLLRPRPNPARDAGVAGAPVRDGGARGREGGMAPAAQPGPAEAPSPPGAASGANPSRIEGSVVNAATAAPIPAAAVRIAIDPGAGPDDDRRWFRELTADAKGRFAIDGLADASYIVHASSEGSIDGEESGVFPGDTVRLALVPDAGFPCRIEVDRGDHTQPVANTEVTLDIRELGWSMESRTDRAGAFRVSGVAIGDFEAARRDNRVDVIVQGFTEPSIEVNTVGDGYVISVDVGATVSGVVLDKDTRRPVPLAVVHAETGQEAQVDAQGRFVISGVADNLTAYAPGYGVETKQLEDPPEAGVTARMDFRLKRGLVLKGKVVDGSGRPLAGVRIGVTPDELNLDSDSELLERRLLELLGTFSAEDGAYRLQGLPTEALDLPGDLELEVRPPGAETGWTETIEVAAEKGEVEVDIVLDLVAVQRGIVLGADGTPVARASVYLESVSDDFGAAARTTPSGEFTLKNMHTGTYRLRVEVAGTAVCRQEVEVPVDRIEARLEKLEGVEAMVRAADDRRPIAGVEATLRTAASELGPALARPVATGADGHVALKSVPRGDYVLALKRPRAAQAFTPLAPAFELPVHVAEGGWTGTVDFPVAPSGSVVLHFEAFDDKGAAIAARGPIQIVATLLQGQGGNVKVESKELRIEASQGLHGRWREGNYQIKCTFSAGTETFEGQDAFTVGPAALVERTIALRG